MNARRFALVAMTLALGACGTARVAGSESGAAKTGPTAAVPDLSAYRLGIGDRVRIDVFGEGDLSLDASVDPTGHISYPLLGSINVLRKTAHQLQQDIAQGLSAGYLVNPDVRVNVVQYRPFYIIGQVRRSGAYPYVVGLTVEKGLALAGGMTDVASVRKIYILREDSPPASRIHVGLDALVLPGDTLIIEESLF
jgi:polysaccharide biosynthesis/export protein VpsN